MRLFSQTVTDHTDDKTQDFILNAVCNLNYDHYSLHLNQ